MKKLGDSSSGSAFAAANMPHVKIHMTGWRNLVTTDHSTAVLLLKHWILRETEGSVGPQSPVPTSSLPSMLVADSLICVTSKLRKLTTATNVESEST